MPRGPRKKSATGIYHVVIRGADRQLMFEEDRDFQKYLDMLQYYKQECDFELFAYCLMDNHIHLLIKERSESLSTIFRKLNTCYSVWFNMKYQRTGALQQGRFYSEPVEDNLGFINVLCYIHLNPIKAGLEDSIGSSYRWSSFQDYIKNRNHYIDTQPIINYLGGIHQFAKLHDSYKDSKLNCLDVDQFKKRLPDDVAKDMIFQESNCKTVTDFQKLSIIDRNKYLCLLHQKGVSIRQLNRLTGTPKGVIDRVVTGIQLS